MPQQKAKQNTSGLTFLRKHKKLTILLLLIVLAVGGILVYQKVALELNKRAFQQARLAVDEIYADIVKEVGTPDDQDSSQHCGGFQGPYGEGPPSCYLSRTFIYPVTDKHGADQLRGNIKNVIDSRSNLFLPTQAPATDPSITNLAESSSAPVANYYQTKAGIECTTVYIFDPTSTILELKENGTNRKFYINISCSGKALGKYF